MNYLHENDTDGRTLQDVVDAIDVGLGYDSVVGKTCAEIKPDNGRLGNSIPVLSEWEAHLTASEISALWDPSIMTTPRSSLLPETKEDWIIIARFIESLTESDFTLPIGIVNFNSPNGLGLTVEEKYKAWVMREEGLSTWMFNLRCIVMHPTLFLMENIEDTTAGFIRSDVTRSGSIDPPAGAFLAEGFDSPLNPYHKSNNPDSAKALKLRCITSVMIDAIMNREYNTGQRTHHKGIHLFNLTETYRMCKDILPVMVRDAFENVMKEIHSELIGQHDGVQSDISMYIPASFYSLTQGVDPSVYRKYYDYYLSQTQTNDSNRKIGGKVIDHDGGYDGSYMGVTLDYRGHELLMTKGEVQYVVDMFNRYEDVTNYNLLPEPTSTPSNRFNTITGINVATQRGIEDPQFFSDGTHGAIAYYITNSRYKAYPFRLGGAEGIPTEAYMDSRLDHSFGYGGNDIWTRNSGSSNAMGFNSGNYITNLDYIPEWSGANGHRMQHKYLAYEFAPDDIYAVLSGRKDMNDTADWTAQDTDDIKPIYFTDQTFIHFVDKDFWAVKFPNWGAQGFTADNGFRGSMDNIAGLHHGVGAFWTPDTGCVLMCRSGGNQTNNHETLDGNAASGFYTGWTRHANNFIGGELSDGNIFTTSLFNRSYDEGDKTYTEDGSSFTVIASGNMNPSRYDHDVLTGDVTFTFTHSGDSTGMTCERVISAVSTQNIDTLFEFLPIVESSSAGGATSIQVSISGGSLESPTFDTYIDNITSIRITRFGNSVDIIPDATEHPSGWTMFFDSDIFNYGTMDVWIARVDLHPNRGVATQFPASTTCKYRIEPV